MSGKGGKTLTVSEVALIISGIALGISILSLWYNHLTPFRLKVMHDTPGFNIYEISPSKSGDKNEKTWWIPSFDIGMSFYNYGKRPGEISDIRIVARFTDEEAGNEEMVFFYPKWIVDYSSFHKFRSDRFKWIENSIIREWFPMIVKGHSESYFHVVLEGNRWEVKRNGMMSFTFEVFTSEHNSWIKCADYDLEIHKGMFGWYSWAPHEKRIEQIRKL